MNIQKFTASFRPTNKSFPAQFQNILVGPGIPGKDGATFIPHIDIETGELYWTNDHNLPNPAPIKIVGHSPIKGIDYFTETDKKEIIQTVIQELPQYNGEVIEL